ncbi:MAG: NfeD family protein [Planctomycetes bacterium]|nr:NfeD family protein [Planctomycetota bacterium]
MLIFLQDPGSGQGFLEQVQKALSPDLFTSWEFWAIASAVLLVGEVVTASFLLGAFLPGTVLAALLAACGWSMEVQLVGFIVGTLVGLAFLRPMLLRRLAAQAEFSNVGALIGLQGRVIEAIVPGEVGRVKIQNEEWRARADQVIEVGQSVKVHAVAGNTLEVVSA